jgi:hypothetical protein
MMSLKQEPDVVEGTPFDERLQTALDSDLNDLINTQCVG